MKFCRAWTVLVWNNYDTYLRLVYSILFYTELLVLKQYWRTEIWRKYLTFHFRTSILCMVTRGTGFQQIREERFLQIGGLPRNLRKCVWLHGLRCASIVQTLWFLVVPTVTLNDYVTSDSNRSDKGVNCGYYEDIIQEIDRCQGNI